MHKLLPPGHILPASYHLCKQVVAFASPDTFEYHVCPNLCHNFGHLPKDQWLAHKNNICPVCKTGRRFEWSKTATDRTVIRASKVTSVSCALLTI